MSPEELKEWRKAAGLSQTELGSRIGLSLRQVQEIESGNTPLRTGHQLAVDMASMILANEQQDGSKMTMTALKVFTALEPCVTPEVRARIDFEGVRPVLSNIEVGLISSIENAVGAKLSDAQILKIVSDHRSSYQPPR